MASEFQASGVAQLWFVPVIADMDAPTAAAIAAGEYLNCELIGFEGLTLEQTYIENPSGCSKIVGKVAGLSNLGEPKFDFKLYDGGVTASNPLLTDLAVGTEGYIVYAYSGVNGTGNAPHGNPIAGDMVNVYKVQVGSHSFMTPFSNDIAKWTCAMSASTVVQEVAVV